MTSIVVKTRIIFLLDRHGGPATLVLGLSWQRLMTHKYEEIEKRQTERRVLAGGPWRYLRPQGQPPRW